MLAPSRTPLPLLRRPHLRTASSTATRRTPTHRLLSGSSCDAALSQIPAAVEGVDFTIHREGYLVPAKAFSSGHPNNPHNLPQSFIRRECVVNVKLEAGTDHFVSTWSTPRVAARDIILHCVLGGDGGPPGRGGSSTYDVIVVKVKAFERYFPMYPTIL